MKSNTQETPAAQAPAAETKAEAAETKPQKNGTPAPKIETKSVKHIFTSEERNKMGDELARAIAGLRNTQGDLEQVKASFKSKISEAEARIDRISTDICGGFEMREKRCQVRYFPKERKKRYWLEHDDPDKVPFTLQEEMTQDDFQQDLLQAESKFSKRSEVILFPQAGSDYGVLHVGEHGGKWFVALRVQIGRDKIEERLNSEQPSVKARYDAIKGGAKRFATWLVEKLGKDKAKGFEAGMEKAVLAEKDKVE